MTDSNFSAQTLRYFDSNIETFTSELSELIAIPSVRDISSCSPNAPFGLPIRNAFDFLINWAKREGFEVRDHDG